MKFAALGNMMHACHGSGHSDFQTGAIVDPFMIHELLLTVTETALGSHPRYVFHGGNTGSNPVRRLSRNSIFDSPISTQDQPKIRTLQRSSLQFSTL